MNELEKLREKKFYSKYESAYKILRKFGFDIESGEIKNKTKMMNRAFSESDVCKILGINYLKTLRIGRFCKRQFYVNYWMVWHLQKLDEDIYAWDYYDWLM